MPEAAFDKETFLQLRQLTLEVPIPQNVAEYAVQLCGSSRPDDARASQHVKEYVGFGAGPRGSQNLVMAAKAHALLSGRTAPTVEDVKAVAIPILRHRVVVNHRAVGDGVTSEDVVQKMVDDAKTSELAA